MKTTLFSSLLMGSLALAAQVPDISPVTVRPSNEIEISCRSKAKEIAAETYRSCVIDQKNAQIEQIKKDYQAKLQALKLHYEAELKKLNATKTRAAVTDNEIAPAPAVDKTEKKSEELPATKLPARKATKSVAPGLGRKKVAKKTPPPAPEMATEMTVKLKPALIPPAADDSVMDLPEPIPVESEI